MNRVSWGPHRGTRLGAATTCLCIALASVGSAAAEAPTTQEAATLKGEWEKVREDQEREVRSNGRRLAEIVARERRAPAELEALADKITKDRLSGIRNLVKRDTQGGALVQMADQALADPGRLSELYRAQEEYLSNARRDSATDGPRRMLQDAHAALQKNLDLISSSLAIASEAARAMSDALQRSGVTEQAAQAETAAKEARGRLAARFERERAERERERVQREREAGERARNRP